MASPSFVPDSFAGRRISLAEIDSTVSARLGPTRGLGNSQPACFNRPGGNVPCGPPRALEHQDYRSLL